MAAAEDLNGVMGMMPAFATPNEGDIDATSTIDVDNLRAGVNRMIADGIDVIATTGHCSDYATRFGPAIRIRRSASLQNYRDRPKATAAGLVGRPTCPGARPPPRSQ